MLQTLLMPPTLLALSPPRVPCDTTPAMLRTNASVCAALEGLRAAPLEIGFAAPPAAIPAATPALPASDSQPGAKPPDSTSAGAPPAPGGDAGDQTIVVSAHRYKGWTADPLAGPNKLSFSVMVKSDDLVVAPAMRVYTHVLPKPLRDGLHNLVNLLEEPTVFVNDLLQLHPGRAAKTLARTAINLTMGWGGLFDVSAKAFKMPYRANGFADTMGYYGVKPGPYLVAPLFGPTTVRDLAGRLMDLSLLPMVAGKPFNKPTFGTVRGLIATLDYRAVTDADFQKIRAAGNPYLAYKRWYLTSRQAEIDALKGHKIQMLPVPPVVAPPSAMPPPDRPPPQP